MLHAGGLLWGEGRGKHTTWHHSNSVSSGFDVTVGERDDDPDLVWMTGNSSGQRCAWSHGRNEHVEGKTRPGLWWAAAAAPSWPSGWGSGPGGAGSPAAGSGATGASPQLQEAGSTDMSSYRKSTSVEVCFNYIHHFEEEHELEKLLVDIEINCTTRRELRNLQCVDLSLCFTPSIMWLYSEVGCDAEKKCPNELEEVKQHAQVLRKKA